jgi:hypothetical protein
MITPLTTNRLQNFIDNCHTTYASEKNAIAAINKRVPNAEEMRGRWTVMQQTEGRWVPFYLCSANDPAWMDVLHGAKLPVFGL